MSVVVDALEGGEVPGAVLGVAMLLVSIVCLVACICCRENQRKGFKVSFSFIAFAHEFSVMTRN